MSMMETKGVVLDELVAFANIRVELLASPEVYIRSISDYMDPELEFNRRNDHPLDVGGVRFRLVTY